LNILFKKLSNHFKFIISSACFIFIKVLFATVFYLILYIFFLDQHSLLLRATVHETEPEAGAHRVPRQAGAPRSQVRQEDVLHQEKQLANAPNWKV
jgi:hypothetical protein